MEIEKKADVHIGNRRFLKAWRAAALVYGLLVLLVWFFQDRLIFFPEREIERTPQASGFAYEDVRLLPDPSRPDEFVNGWYLPAPGATEQGEGGAAGRPVILFCHGNARNISSLFLRVQAARELGADLFLFDYRGYGASGGKPSEANMYADARAAWNYLVKVRGVVPERILLYGHSLGGGVASWLATQVQPAALALEATFTSAPDLAQKQFWFLPARWICSYQYDNLANLRAITCPVLFVHSLMDDLIPFAQGQALFDAYCGPKQILKITGTHDTGYAESGRAYLEGVSRFLRTIAKMQ